MNLGSIASNIFYLTNVNTNATVCYEIARMKISSLDNLIDVVQLISLLTHPDTCLKYFVSPLYLFGNILLNPWPFHHSN